MRGLNVNWYVATSKLCDDKDEIYTQWRVISHEDLPLVGITQNHRVPTKLRCKYVQILHLFPESEINESNPLDVEPVVRVY